MRPKVKDKLKLMGKIKRLIVSAYQYNHKKQVGEVFKKPSATIPGDALSVKEIIERHLSGLPITQGRNVSYFPGEPDLDNPDHEDIFDNPDLDLSDIHNALERTYDKLNQKKARLKEEKIKPKNEEVIPPATGAPPGSIAPKGETVQEE